MVAKRFTAEEKTEEMFSLMLQSNEFFTLKELEKLGIKKGINSQHVKDVVDGLVDENRVCREKIGSANYYWVFASQAAVAARNLAERIDNELHATQTKLAMAETSLQSALAEGREPSEMRTEMLTVLADATKQASSLREELKLYGDRSDPVVLKMKTKRIEDARTMAVGHTENVSSLISFARDQFGAEPAQLRAHVDLPDNFEELEDTPALLPAEAPKRK